MATASLVQSTAAFKANTAAEANTIPIRDNQGGITVATMTMTKSVNSGGHSRPHTAIKTGAYAIAAGDDVVYYDASGGAFAVTFPLASEWDGRILTLLNTANSTTALTLTMSGSDTCTNATLTTAYGYATYQSDGTSKWYRIA
jgi:hypothetical protein